MNELERLRAENKQLKTSVSEQEKLIKILRRFEASYRILFDEAPVGYHEIDPKGTVMLVNQTEADIFGYTIEEMLGKSIFDFIIPEHREIARKAFQEKIEHWMPLKGFERTYVRKDGSEIQVYITDQIIRNECAQTIGVRSTVQPVNKDNSISDVIGYHEINCEGIITRVNHVEAEFLGYSVKEMVGRSIFDFMVESQRKDSIRGFKNKIKHGQSEGGFDRKYICKSGKVIRVRINDRPVFDEHGKIIAIRSTVQNINDLKLIEDEREKLLNELISAKEKIKILKGLIPICASCKKIRNDDGYWNEVEKYMSEHSEAVFSHGICPDCMEELYPEYVESRRKKQKE